MFKLLASWIRNRQTRWKAEQAVLEGLSTLRTQISQVYVDTDRLEDYGQIDPEENFPHDAKVKVSRALYKTAFGRNIVEQLVNHIVGPQFLVKFSDPNTDLVYQQERRRFKLYRRYREIVRRVFRDGICLLIKLEDGRIRFVEPDLIRTDERDEHIADGFVLQDPEDCESVVGVYVDNEEFSRKLFFRFVPMYADCDELKPDPLLWIVRRYILKYETFLDARWKLNLYRSLILLLRKHIGKSQEQIQAFADRVKDGTLVRPETGRTEPYLHNLKTAKVIDHNDDVEYEFKAPQTGAAEAEFDGRSIRLTIAAMVQFAEYLLSADASNANYASTAVAESPWVKSMEANQEDIGEQIVDFIQWLNPRLVDPVLTYPQLVSRDHLKETQRHRLMWEAGILSSQTWQELEGLDPKVETGRLASSGEIGI